MDTEGGPGTSSEDDGYYNNADLGGTQGVAINSTTSSSHLNLKKVKLIDGKRKRARARR